MPSVWALHGLFLSIVHVALWSDFWHIASYFVFWQSAILLTMKKTKETTFQYLYASITVMQLYLASFYPILYVFVFPCTFSQGPEPIFEKSSAFHWNDSSSLEGPPISGLSHSREIGSASRIQMSFASLSPQSLKVVHFPIAEEQISALYHKRDSPWLFCCEASLMPVWVQTQQSKAWGRVHISAYAVDQWHDFDICVSRDLIKYS